MTITEPTKRTAQVELRLTARYRFKGEIDIDKMLERWRWVCEHTPGSDVGSWMEFTTWADETYIWDMAVERAEEAADWDCDGGTCVEDFMTQEMFAPKPRDPMAPTPGQIDIFGGVVGESGTSGYPGGEG